MTPTALQTVNNSGDLIQFDNTKIALIKKMVAKDATNDELDVFLHQCRRTGLDPLAKQIYFRKQQTKNGPVVTIITGIDGYRLIADRTGKYAGNDDPVFDDEHEIHRATVTVYKLIGGVRCPFTATARWSQYYPGEKQGFMWDKMPHLMLGKCAEALALRKAFPAELSGLYVKEEMDQAGPEIVEAETGPAVPFEGPPAKLQAKDEPSIYKATPTQKKVLDGIFKRMGITEIEDMKAISQACVEQSVEMYLLGPAVKDWLSQQVPR